ncbi:MAG: sarcosine oxidase subunit alpha family protein [Xanthomonadales bacterium]|nr:sarcosine oxidase subunit alpha family protein [Xanthomonadales bacterium]
MSFVANSYRLQNGGQIDRQKPLNFSFNGDVYSGFEGDTLASALLANRVTMLSRSFKYHRPRGIFSAGEEEPNALLEIGQGARREPSCRAPMVPLREGLVARSQNGWPSLGFDVGRSIDYSHALWPAGFYNKTFKWPSWHSWEEIVRRMAGLGRPLTEADPDHYEQVNAHCDLLIVGGGPTGLAAALVAGRAGLRVMLVDQNESFGGVLNWEPYQLDGADAGQWVQSVADELASLAHVTLLPRTTVAGSYDHNVTTLLQRSSGSGWRECYWTVRPRQVLLAAGAIEQGMIFPENDRPGIMLAGAVRDYLHRYAVVPGEKVVIAANNDTAYQTALDLHQAGITVSAVVDGRVQIDAERKQQLQALGIELLAGARIAGTRGDKALREIQIEQMDGIQLGRKSCDLLAVSGGWSPRVHLFSHARGSLKFDVNSQSFHPDRLPKDFSVVGSANGTVGLAECWSETVRATEAICASLGRKAADLKLPVIDQAPVESAQVSHLAVNSRKKRQWIDLAHDVTFGDAELAVREGYVSVEHFKRYTTTGMSVDQGKTGNLNAFIALGALTGRETGSVGTTTFRPPYMPVTLSAIAAPYNGKFFAPRRLLPAHTVHQQLNGAFDDFAGWQRPECYPRVGETEQQAIQREALAVRHGVGVFDNSPIGKIEVRGPHAAEFLNRFYINNVLTLKTGKVRYGLMLNENGIIIDDGVFVRLAENHFLVHTTSGGAARITEMMEEWLQCEWPGMQVLLDDTTTQWANFTVAGPAARELLTRLGTDIDISADTLPHMSAACGQVMGLDARVVRVSFSGELSFEINIPARHAAAFLQAVLLQGEDLGITPYGIESLMVLRLEKGYLHLGSDTDGTSTPDDVGWGVVAREKATDYIGKRSLFRPANLDENRQQLVGLAPADASQPLEPGAHLLLGENRQVPARTDGWVTSACYSPNLKRPIALGVLAGGSRRMGEIVTVIDEQKRYHARVVEMVQFDKGNERLKS